MPELPEVETMRRGIQPCIGMRIDDIELVASPRRPIKIAPRRGVLTQRVTGATIVGTDRAGKRVVLLLDTGDRLVFEPRMTGLVLLADPPTQEHLRMRLRLGHGRGVKGRTKPERQGKDKVRSTQYRVRSTKYSASSTPYPVLGTENSVLSTRYSSPRNGATELLYWDRRGLGSVRLMTPSEFAVAFSADRLGPDALGTTADMLCERLGASRRAIKVALLDQRGVAGIGNLYASEILHRAEIHPAISCRRLKLDHWQRIAAATRRILAAAIRYEGSTLSDGTYRNALNQSGSYQNHHRVYDRAGELCTRCRKHKVRRIVQAQRSTFFCPGCQRLRTAGA